MLPAKPSIARASKTQLTLGATASKVQPVDSNTLQVKVIHFSTLAEIKLPCATIIVLHA